MKRRLAWAGAALLVAAGLFMLVLSVEEPPGPSAGVPDEHAALPERASSAPVPRPSFAARAQAAARRGELSVRGRVLGPDGPVAGAQVVATGAADDVLSEMECHCDNHCGRKLLECGCGEAAGQLLDVVADRSGEAAPLAYATSGADGAFELAGLGEGSLAIWAESEGVGIGVRTSVRAGDAGADVTLAAGVVLVGRALTDGEAPVPGALVTAIYDTHSRFFEALAGADGSFRIGPVPAGAYTLVGAAAGLLPGRERVGEARGGPLVLTLPAPRRLAGKVRSGGAPAVGVTVRLDGEHRKARAETDRAGAFQFDELRPGRYALEAGRELRAAYATVEIEPGKDPGELLLELEDSGGVDGVVVDERGLPVAGAELVVGREGAHRATAGTDGAFHLAPIAPGSHSLTASAKGFVDHREKALEVIPGSLVEVKVTLRRSVPVRGRVVDSAGAAVSGARVSASFPEDGSSEPAQVDREGRSAHATSGDDGAFELEGLLAGKLELSVEHEEFVGYEGRIVAPDAAVRVRLDRGGEVTGTVVEEGGQPIPGALLSLQPAADGGALQGFRAGKSGEDGSFRLRGVADGGYELIAMQARPDGSAPRTAPGVSVEVRRGKAPPLVVQFPAGLAIKGKVVDLAGAPIAGASVMAMPPREELLAQRRARGPGVRRWDLAIGDGRSGPDGTFTVQGLKAGTYELTVTAPGFEQPDREKRPRAVAGAEALVLVLERLGRVRGRVVREDGKPIEAFTINGRMERDPAGVFEVVTGDGEVTVVVGAEGLAPESRTADVPKGESVTLADIVLRAGRTVHGQVVDADSREPIAGARAWFDAGDAAGAYYARRGRDREGVAISDAAGRFQLGQLPVTPGVIHVERTPGYAPAALPLPSSGDLGVVLLGHGGTVSGVVLGADGAPVGQAMITISGPVESNARPGPDGRFELTGLPAGHYTLDVLRRDSPGADEYRKELDVPDGAAVEVELRPATGGATVTVRVQGPSGTPFRGSVGLGEAGAATPTTMGEVMGLTTSLRMARGAPDEPLRIEHVRPGSYTLFVLVMADAGLKLHRQPLEVGEAPLVVDVRLPADLPTFAPR